jgi:HlyD family secretion protein
VADLGRLHAIVYVAEAQIGRIELGARARVYVDAYPERAFDARVARIAQRAEFTPRDVHMPDERTRQVFAVELEIENPTLALKPGMPVDARIRVKPGASWGDGLP